MRDSISKELDALSEDEPQSDLLDSIHICTQTHTHATTRPLPETDGSGGTDTYFGRLVQLLPSWAAHPALHEAAAGTQFRCQVDAHEAVRSTNFIYASY